jgi:hypothetical protein
MAFTLRGKLGIPDSRYAAELDRRAAEARFAPDLEAEFDEFFLSERRAQVRSFNGMLCVLSLCALVLAFGHAPGRNAPQILRLCVIALSCGVLTWAAFSRLYQQFYLAVARWGSLLIASFGGLEIAHRVAAGQGESLAVLAAYSIGLFFMAGLRFGAALQASLALIASFTIALLWNGQSMTQVAHAAGIIAIILLVVGFAYFQQTLGYRKAFLERGLIADLAARDGLTGLKNRRAFDEHLIRSWQQGLRDRK